MKYLKLLILAVIFSCSETVTETNSTPLEKPEGLTYSVKSLVLNEASQESVQSSLPTLEKGTGSFKLNQTFPGISIDSKSGVISVSKEADQNYYILSITVSNEDYSATFENLIYVFVLENVNSVNGLLQKLTYTSKHKSLGYNLGREKMYEMDNQNNTIVGVYSGYTVSWNKSTPTTYPAPINCEHTVPQSLFNKNEPMRSDIHHLFPTYENWNSTRGNHPFGDVEDSKAKWMRSDQSQTTIPTSNIDEYSEYYNQTFEPREDHKGNVARAIFYFYTMYPTQAGDISKVASVETLLKWNELDPVDANEIERNNQIEKYQGNRNPYIDNAQLASYVWQK